MRAGRRCRPCAMVRIESALPSAAIRASLIKISCESVGLDGRVRGRTHLRIDDRIPAVPQQSIGRTAHAIHDGGEPPRRGMKSDSRQRSLG